MYPLPGNDILDLIKTLGALNEGTVHLWIADLRKWKSHSQHLRSLLSDDENIRLDRLKINDKKNEFLCSRGILRIILSYYLTKNPSNLPILNSPAGKPFVPGTEVQFNISHSKDYLLCGISSGERIGLDIQEIYTISSIDSIIKNYFNPNEVSYLRSLKSSEIFKDQFFAIWTAKEAYFKAVGDGIRESFNKFILIPDSADTQNFILDIPGSERERSKWTIKSLEIAQGYFAAVAYEGSMTELNRCEILPEFFFEI